MPGEGEMPSPVLLPHGLGGVAWGSDDGNHVSVSFDLFSAAARSKIRPGVCERPIRQT